jgi:DNA-binding response OmpR family regulator
VKRLLLVEDDRALSTGLADAFRQEEFEVVVARDGVKARDQLLGSARAAAGGASAPRGFDVVVLDLMLPGRSGLDVLRELRAKGDATPVLVLTARGAESDKVLGLELGADDYVTKPFSLRELVARVRALVRRAAVPTSVAATDWLAAHTKTAGFTVGDAKVDLAAFEVRRAGSSLPLSRKEAALLALLHARRGRAVTRDDFLDAIWDGGDHVGTRTIDTHLLNLRQKLEPDPARPRFLLTVHGVGYRLVVDEPRDPVDRAEPTDERRPS